MFSRMADFWRDETGRGVIDRGVAPVKYSAEVYWEDGT